MTVTSHAGHESTAREYVERVINGLELDALDELCADSVTYTTPQVAVSGREELKTHLRRVTGMYHTVRYAIDALVSHDGIAVGRITLRGVIVKDPRNGRTVTPRNVTHPAVIEFHFVGDRIERIQLIFDAQSYLSQITLGEGTALR